MSHPTRPFVVVDAAGQILGDMPTPLLIQQGGGEAYEDPETLGIWRARDDAYDRQLAARLALQADLGAGEWEAFVPTYTRVRVKHRPECPGDRALNMAHLVELGTTLYGPRGLCYDCATYDGVPTGDELAAGRER